MLGLQMASVWLGKRIRLDSPGSLTPMRPSIRRGSDELCNDTLRIHAWPLGGVVIWWRRRQRTLEDGPCALCLKWNVSVASWRSIAMPDEDTSPLPVVVSDHPENLTGQSREDVQR